MASSSIDFSDIKIIICVQGYCLDYQFVVRELGYWCNGQSSSIPFNVKLNKNHLDLKNQRIVLNCEEEINGIKLKRNFENALAASDIKPVLKTLYHLNSNNNAKYIAIIRDEGLDGLLYKSGLGNYVIHLDNVNIIRNSSLPNNETIRQYLKKNSENYTVCSIHDRLRINEFPFCAKVKAEFLADYCRNMIKIHQTNITPDNNNKCLQTFINEFEFGN